jgi:hypothetical protein
VYLYRWPNAELRWESGWLRVASRDGDLYAVGTPGDFRRRRARHLARQPAPVQQAWLPAQDSTRTDWFANFDAVRDEPANILHQFVIAGGLGNTWRKTDRMSFRTAYGITYTDEDLAVEGANRFAGYRFVCTS